MATPALASPLVIDSSLDVQSVSSHFEVLKHHPGFSLDKVLKQEDRYWQQTEGHTFNDGPTNQAYWFRATIRNDSSKSHERYLELSQQTIDIFDLYVLENDQLRQTFQLGDTRDMANRPIVSNKFIVPLMFAPNTTTQLVVYVNSQGGPLQVFSNLWQPLHFFAEKQKIDFLNIICYGGSLALALYNLFLFFSTRQKAYAFYTFYALMFVYSFASFSGYTQIFLWPDSPAINQSLSIIAAVVCRVSIYLFAIQFLKIDEELPKLALVIRLVIATELVNLGLALFALTSQDLSLFANSYIMLSKFVTFPIPLCLGAGCYLLLKGLKEARFFCLAWLILGVASTIYSLSLTGKIPFHSAIPQILKVAQLLEMILLSFALADRLNIARQKEVLYLREKVEREHELEYTRSELSAAQHKYQDLEEQYQSAVDEQTTLTKKSIIARISHEIRTPMNSILGYCHLIGQDPSLPAPLKANVDAINRSGEHLLGLVHNALEADMVEVGQAGIHLEATDFHSLLAHLQHKYQRLCGKKNLQLRFSYRDNTPYHLMLDQEKLSAILDNLLSNALKFTAKGSIHLNATTHPAGLNDEDGGSVSKRLSLRIEVSDTGSGIAQEDQDKVFIRFEQTQSGLNHGQGIGQGLAVHREYARLMGGDLTFSSARAQGSTFCLSLLCDPSEDQPNSSQTPPQPALVAIDPHRPLTGDALQQAIANIPTNTKQAMTEAILLGDVLRIQQLLDELQTEQQPIAEQLNNMAERFDYEAMLELLD